MQNFFKSFVGMFLIVAITIAIMAILIGCSTMNKQAFTNCEVKAKDILLDGDGDGGITKTKRVSTTCGSFDVEDNIAGGFNSWDIWTQLEVGKVYDIKTGGYRVGFTSSFPNVLEVTPR